MIVEICPGNANLKLLKTMCQINGLAFVVIREITPHTTPHTIPHAELWEADAK